MTTFPELDDWETARVALQARLMVQYPEVKVSINVQLTEDVTVISVMARDHSTPDAPIVWGQSEPFPGVPSIAAWLNWLASAPS